MSTRQIAMPGQDRPDALLIGITALLLAIGLLMVTSASIALGDRQHGDAFYFLERQLFAAVLGLAAGWVMVKIPTRIWQSLGSWLAGIALALLVLVLIPGLGHTANGSTRWLSVAGINIVQVSEPARLMLLMYVADYAVRRNQELRSGMLGMLKPLLIVGAAGGLLLLQPDFGSAVLLVAMTLCRALHRRRAGPRRPRGRRARSSSPSRRSPSSPPTACAGSWASGIPGPIPTATASS